MLKKLVTWSLVVAIIIGVFSLSYFFAIDKIGNKKALGNKENSSNVIEIQQDNPVEVEGVVSDDIISPEAMVKFIDNENKGNEILASISVKKLNVNTATELEKMYAKGRFKVEKVSKEEITLVKQKVDYEKNKYYIGLNQGNIAIYKTDQFGKRTEEDLGKTITIQRLINKAGDMELVNQILNDNAFYNSMDEVENRLEECI